jgi:thiamine biosynthesis lipoprotein
MAPGCTNKNNTSYSKYSYEFIGAFDTVIQFMGYSKSQKDFEEIAQVAQSRFMELHKLFDIYNDYEGINNIKTINDNAGIKPVEVQQEIIDLILFAKEWYAKTNGVCNIALGPMLRIWHDYREAASADPDNAQIPSIYERKAAMAYTDINKVIVDADKKTVYLEDKNMRLDVGAIAKGYASEIVAKELEAKGVDSLIISSGGNVRTIGQPRDGIRTKWGIGIQNPDGNPLDSGDEPLDIVFLKDASVVTSGDYQRYYMVDGRKYHHLISPITLMPANYYRSVSIVTEDSGVADFMSTTLFLTPYEEGRALAESLGIEAIWVFPDGSIQTTEIVRGMMKNLGGASGE